MDVEDLRRIGLLDHWEALDRIASAPLSAEDVEDVLEAADDVTRSRWSPRKTGGAVPARLKVMASTHCAVLNTVLPDNLCLTTSRIESLIAISWHCLSG